MNLVKRALATLGLVMVMVGAGGQAFASDGALPKIGTGDFDTKTRKVEKFLGEGHKVKVTIMFRGRETQHPELGRRILDNVAERVAQVARVEVVPKLDGRNMTMVLAPDKKAKAARDAQRKVDAETSAEPAVETAKPEDAA